VQQITYSRFSHHLLHSILNIAKKKIHRLGASLPMLTPDTLLETHRVSVFEKSVKIPVLKKEKPTPFQYSLFNL